MTKQLSSSGQDFRDFITFLAGLFERGEAMSYGAGEVTMCSHMLQTADLAQQAGTTPELVVASLLHDIGHFGTDYALDSDDSRHTAMLSATQNRRHEDAGADLLEPLFGVDVAEPVRLHVLAKRYLCAIEPDYLNRLADTTLHTLGLQGGPMTPDEVKAFEGKPHAQAAAALRRWDDFATHKERRVPGFEHYRCLLETLLKERARENSEAVAKLKRLSG